MKTITIKIGKDVHKLVIDKGPQYASTCLVKCSLRAVCLRLRADDMLCRSLLAEISDSWRIDFPNDGHFELKEKPSHD